jgi:hypothetical protein
MVMVITSSGVSKGIDKDGNGAGACGCTTISFDHPILADSKKALRQAEMNYVGKELFPNIITAQKVQCAIIEFGVAHGG